MSQLRFACVATAMWAFTTCTQALEARENTSGDGGQAQTFKCEPIEQGQNRIVAGDLPHTVILSLRLKGQKADEFKVLYLDEEGKKTKPVDETKAWKLVTIPGRRDYSWYAMADYRQNLLIHGRLFEQDSARNSGKRWFYSEEQFENGLKTVDYQTTCSEEG
jgi:hypothetical protein